MNEYETELTEVAEFEVQQIFLWYSGISPNAARRWIEGWNCKLDSLRQMPDRCPIAREADRFPEITLRQHLFGKYRILFHIIQPTETEPGIVRVLHVVHGARDSF